MSLSDLLRSSLFNLRRRKLRSALTVFAVVIGAALVSLLVSIGIGTQDFLTAQIKATMPRDVLMVASNPDAFQVGVGGLGFGAAPQEISDGEGSAFTLEPLTLQNIQDISELEHVERIDPNIILSADSVRLQGSDRRFRVQVRAIPAYQVEEAELVAGRYLSDQSRGECIIANQYLNSFGFARPDDALGQEVAIEVSKITSFIGLPGEKKDFIFEIVGVTEKTLRSTQILIPVEDGKDISRFWSNTPDLYTDEVPPAIVQVRVDDAQYVGQVADNVEDLGLGAVTSDDILGIVGTIFGVVQAVLSAFGLIALGVASLGIVNTLIMAIHERTREIGVMKAVGASQGTIRLLFTTEGATIGFFGGIIGVAIGWALGFVANRVSHATFLRDFETFNISIVPWWLVVGVVALTTVIALLAALYPSYRAARLDPIEALRAE